MTLRRLVQFAREAVLFELALYRSLFRWVARRPDVPGGATPIGYAQLAAPLMWVWIFASGSEAVAVELLLRNLDAGWAEAIRLPVLVIGIWGFLWMLGLLAAYRVRPHLLTDDRLRIRNAARTWVEVPLHAVASTTLIQHDLPGTIRSMHHEDGLLLVGVSSLTNLELILTESTVLATSKGELTAHRVGLWVDEPRVVAAQLKDLVAARS